MTQFDKWLHGTNIRENTTSDSSRFKSWVIKTCTENIIMSLSLISPFLLYCSFCFFMRSLFKQFLVRFSVNIDVLRFFWYWQRVRRASMNILYFIWTFKGLWKRMIKIKEFLLLYLIFYNSIRYCPEFHSLPFH